jgi:ribosome-associated protein
LEFLSCSTTTGAPCCPKGRAMTDDQVPFVKPSKTAKKKELLNVQTLAAEIIALTDGELKTMPFEPGIRGEIDLARKLTARSARKRQLLFLSKKLRDEDLPAIRKAIALLKIGKSADTARFHELEILRDQLLEGGNDVIEKILAKYPTADVKQLTKLQSDGQREQTPTSKVAVARLIFRYLRKISEELESK